jgi:PAS domain S-box-containing protein
MHPRTLARLQSEAPLPAQVAIRITLVVAVLATSVVTFSGVFRSAIVPIVMWVLAGGLALVGYYPRIPERVQTFYVASSWFIVGHVIFYDAGLRGGPGVILIAIALIGLFFGARRAFIATAVSTLIMGFAGYAEVSGWWAPGQPNLGDVGALWGVHTLAFAVLSTMLILVQSTTMKKAIGATARARHFALAAERVESAIFITDAHHAIEWVNDAFTSLTGFSQAEATGKTLLDLMRGPATQLASLADLRSGGPEASGEAFQAELVLYPRGPRVDEPLWIRLEIRAFSETVSTARGFTVILHDITQARIDRELERVQRVLSISLTEARHAREGFEALAVALGGCDGVLCARTFQFVRGRPELVKCHVTHASRFDMSTLETHFIAAPTPETRPVGRPLVEPRQTALAHSRVLCAIAGPTPGLLEVSIAVDSPGRALIVDRLPDLTDQLARFLQREAEQARFRSLFDHSPDALVLVDPQGRVEQHNALASGLWPSLAKGDHAALPSELTTLLAELLGQETPEDALTARTVGWRMLRPGDLTRDLEASLAPMPLPEGRGVLLSVRDVTARKSVERALEEALVDVREALAEREILLKEIHHRVKNNLQIVSSLLAMQADRSASPEVRRDLEESVHRVRSMALIHQSLYGGADLARIDLSAYARTLALDLCGALDATARVEVETTPTEVNVEQAIPCGLILNELIINALKHGRGADGSCQLRVEVGREGHQVALRVSDKGPGLPPTFNPRDMRRATSLGMRIITALTRQLGARLDTNAGEPQSEARVGARFTLIVPPEPEPPPGTRRPTQPGMKAVRG